MTAMAQTLKYRLPLRRPLVALRHRGISRHDVFLASYPRSGSTWMRFMLVETLGHQSDYENIREMIPPVGRQSKALARLPDGGRVIKSHERREFPHGRRCHRAIYLLRDGRDVAVSYYIFMRRNGTYAGSLSEFIPLFVSGHIDGYGPWQAHVSSWLDSAPARSGDLHVVKYEDLLADPLRSLSATLDYLGVRVDDASLRDAVEANRFDRMRRRSSRSPRVRATAVRGDIPIVRKGTAGDWRNHFSEADRETFSRHAGRQLERCGYDPL